MSFYAKANSYNISHLHDSYSDFIITNKDHSYTVNKAFYASTFGSPGGQLVTDIFFGLDSIYKTVHLTKTKNNYLLDYTFEDDTIYNEKSIKKSITINKSTFLPTTITRTSEKLGERTSRIFQLDSILVNGQVKNSIANYKNNLQYLELEKTEKPVKISFVGAEFATENLLELWHDKPVVVSDQFPALISFWEFWCSPCIEALPKLKTFQNRYKDKVNVVGISSQSFKRIKQLLLDKNIKILNLKGNNKLLDQYKINSFPTYFLVDKNGVIIKEYSSFSNAIEKDIKEL
ncbi:TlpA family protein disulfide reductase [Lacinutrix sp. C3R15]|uniref:TlpA family protein disulfide reductase n=1 Tax=Flavobacteriaceae TaxID=49546 RepID=UPI001C08FAF3|nr:MULTISPECIES: TlpA disulfide reductase family protein [Flavobacteriaceae]MBU2938102.1 TlpA family protein disulfide reductase [Lacinutrix sp. C3R15]MDO6621416.1 TlpA disulfide reductase family protein [Oceanihabitans sp. 1_MG-2023]